MFSKRIIAVLSIVLITAVTGCSQKTASSVEIIGGADGPTTIFLAEKKSEDGYMKISQEEAKVMMEQDDGHVIVDVRRQDEYDSGHIPGAICIPNESITDTMPEELPDLDQIILIYCRSGRRSKEAGKKLADMGYTNVYEFGGILDWDGEIE